MRLRGANLKLKPSKVRIFQREIGFLGHRISEGGVAMDPSKVADVVNWPVPTNIHEIRQFLGLIGYYRRFVKDFSRIAAPLHELTRTSEAFVWDDRRNRAFLHQGLFGVSAHIGNVTG